MQGDDRHIEGGCETVYSAQLRPADWQPPPPPKIYSGKICTIENAVSVGTSLRLYCFRGHDKLYNDLTPGVFRTDDMFEESISAERNLVSEFRRQAHAIAEDLPPTNDYLGWLMLMQHHGLPTRLLDWTSNILVALYFAVHSDPDSAGELWAMYPPALNRITSGIPVLATRDERTMRYLSWEPFGADGKEMMTEMRMIHSPHGPMAFQPPLTFRRMVAQQAVFTIHPNPHNYVGFLDLGLRPPPGGKGFVTPERILTIPEILGGTSQLIRYIIPACAKASLLQALESLGIDEGSLFVSLDALAKTIWKRVRAKVLPPSEPPPLLDESPP